MSSALDVKWPIPSLLLESQHFGTYPSQPVIATIKYKGISCVPANGIPVAAYILQLIYCGTTAAACDPQNNSRTQVRCCAKMACIANYIKYTRKYAEYRARWAIVLQGSHVSWISSGALLRGDKRLHFAEGHQIQVRILRAGRKLRAQIEGFRCQSFRANDQRVY